MYDKIDDLPEYKQNKLKTKDPCEYINAITGNQEPSISAATYKALQRQPRTEAQLTGTNSNGLLTLLYMQIH